MAAEPSAWRKAYDRLQKPRPTALDKHDRRVARETEYRENRKKAMARDRRRCRIYGLVAVETHHVVPRSLGGSHDVSNLLSVSKKAHDEFTANILKVEGSKDANGLLRILKWSDAEKGYVVFRERA